MSARDEILSHLRRSLHVTGKEAPRLANVASRIAGHPSGVIPARGQGDAAARLETFRAEILRAGATLADVADAAEAPGEVARYLRDANLPATLRRGDDERLAAMPWGDTTLEANGLGSYIAHMTAAGDFHRIALGICVMCIFVMGMNHFVWRRLYRIAEERMHF